MLTSQHASRFPKCQNLWTCSQACAWQDLLKMDDNIPVTQQCELNAFRLLYINDEMCQ